MFYFTYSQNIDQGMLRSAQPNQFSTYPTQNIDIPGLAVLRNGQRRLRALVIGSCCLYIFCVPFCILLFNFSEFQLCIIYCCQISDLSISRSVIIHNLRSPHLHILICLGIIVFQPLDNIAIQLELKEVLELRIKWNKTRVSCNVQLQGVSE